uniref:Transient receptor potential cation channel subfamily M member 2 n=1 Tax=Zonotrichia albicollis TaxID=44394 RepID=A0A8D2MFC3_ZONAL
MSARGRCARVLPSELNKVCPERGDEPATHPSKMSDFEVVPNLQQSSSSVSRSRRKAHFPENLISWIPENIRKKECTYFVESSQTSDSGRIVCECGYLREQHLDDAAKPPIFLGKEWDPSRHIQEMPTDAFGDIRFTGLGQKTGKYVRVSSDTPPRVIYHLMTQHWGLDPPNLLISVTGGAKNFVMKPRLKNIFRQGLVKVAQTTGAWIITGGSHAGVMKQVGEAVRDFMLSCSHKEGDIVTIGIATWGTVYNRESLICPMGGFPAEYMLDEENQGSLSCLDSNHSHFILVDDGTHGRYGVEIPLRTRLEKFISEQTKVKGGVAIKIPIVCVVLEGGPGTLDTIYNAITHGTPCVIVEGSGRVADVIAQVANLPVAKITIALIQSKLSVLFQDTYELFTESKLVEWTKKIQDIVRSRQLLTIFREGKYGQQDVDVAILQALFKASRNQDHFGRENWDHQLKLAVAWNRVDIARSEIFTDDHDWKPSDLHPVMAAALISNKPDFVKLFLEQGVRLKDFVTWDTLVYLYDNLAPSCLFHSKLQKVLLEEREHTAGSKVPRLQMHHVSQVLRELLGCSTQPLYPKPKQAERPRLSIPVPHIKLNVQGSSLRSLYKRSPGRVTFTMDPVRDLLIWAVVQNRRELAEIIWAQSQDCMAAALACSKILKELAKEEEDTDTTDDMLALAEEYEHKAIGVFTECYRKDEERAQKLLTRVSEAWGKTTCLQLALEAKNMNFVSHGGVQAFLTKVWWGKLSVDNGLWRVITCMLFFPLLYTKLITFREKRLQPPMGCLARLRAFFTAPIVIFLMNTLSYFSFLLLFAYVLMVDFQPTPSWREYLIYFWLFSLVCEETRQLLYDPDGLGIVKMASLYIKDFWNKLDICAILVFIAGLTCRLIPSTLYPGRIILSLAFIIFCLRLMHIFTVSRTLGPKIIIVKRMMKDVFFFLFLLAVWVVSFGVAKQAILIHNEERVEWLFRGVVYHSYLTIFGTARSSPAAPGWAALTPLCQAGRHRVLCSWEVWCLHELIQPLLSPSPPSPGAGIHSCWDLQCLRMLGGTQGVQPPTCAFPEACLVRGRDRIQYWPPWWCEPSSQESELSPQQSLEHHLGGTPRAGQRKTLHPEVSLGHVSCRWISRSTTPLPTRLSTRTWQCRTPSACECPPRAPQPSSLPWWHSQPSQPGCLPPCSSLESLLKINYNTMDGLIDRQSFHGLYTVQDGLPLNPMGRTGLRGRGRLHCFGPNHALHPVVTRGRGVTPETWKSLKKMLEVLVAQYPLSDVWALPGGGPAGHCPTQPQGALREVLRALLRCHPHAQVHKGYLDDPRNTDNAWVETVAISVHFDTQHDLEMKRLNSFLQGCDPELCIRWQVLDKRIPLHANHKELLHKVSTLLGAYY